jgi:hypothetical protein
MRWRIDGQRNREGSAIEFANREGKGAYCQGATARGATARLGASPKGSGSRSSLTARPANQLLTNPTERDGTGQDPERDASAQLGAKQAGTVLNRMWSG